MCPHGYHHSGSMATSALGTRDERLHIVWIALWSHQSAQTVNSELCIVQIVNVPRRGLSSQSKRVLKLHRCCIKCRCVNPAMPFKHRIHQTPTLHNLDHPVS